MTEYAALCRLDGQSLEASDLAALRGATFASRSPLDVHSLSPGFALLAANGSFGGLQIAPPAHSSGAWLALDGRLDDSAALATCLDFDRVEAGRLGAAGLMARAFDRLGDRTFELWVGPFAAAIFHPHAGHLQLARDPAGARTIFLRRVGPTVAFASRPSFLLRLFGKNARWSEETVALFLAGRGPRPGASFFQEIDEIQPGEVVRCDSRGNRVCRIVSLRPSPVPGRGRERDYEERFRELLNLAVGSRMAGGGKTAILMSGGLDSTAIAATAARLSERTEHLRPLAISWTFGGREGIDESLWIDATVRASHLAGHRVAGEALWPLGAEPDWIHRLDAPSTDLFWRLHRAAQDAARADGRVVLLTGEGGDQLWQGGRDWLRDLVNSLNLGPAALGAVQAARLELRGTRLEHPLWNSLGRLLRPTRPMSFEPAPDWMTSDARSLIEMRSESTGDADTALALRRRKLVPPAHLAMAAAAARDAEAAGIRLARPFRDRRLLEFFLAIPARYLYRPGETKRLLRSALADRLPDVVRLRRTPTSLKWLADRGLAQLGRARLAGVLEDPNASWRSYVRAEWIRAQSPEALERSRNGRESVILWHCYCLEHWKRAVETALDSRAGAP